MAYDEQLADRVRTHLHHPDLSEKKMFGGLCFLISGNMCCGIVKEEIMLRVGPDKYEGLLAKDHAREMDFTGRSLKGMLYIDVDGIAQDKDLKFWLNQALDFAASLPPKQPKSKATPKKKAAKNPPGKTKKKKA